MGNPDLVIIFNQGVSFFINGADYETIKIGNKYIGEFSKKIEKYQGKNVKLTLEVQK